MSDTYHIITHSRGWAFTRSKLDRALKVFRNKSEAERHAKKKLKDTGRELFIHDKAGMVTSHYHAL